MRKAKDTMSKSRTKAPDPMTGRRLAADCRRVLADAQDVLGAFIANEGEAMTVARRTADRLAILPPERRRLISLFDDLTEMTARLISEKTDVERRLLLGTHHKAAGRAYKAGDAR